MATIRANFQKQTQNVNLECFWSDTVYTQIHIRIHFRFNRNQILIYVVQG